MFGLGMLEILMILAIALIVVGPKKLPELARTLGKAMGEFKRSAQELKRTMDLESSLKETDIPETNIVKEATLDDLPDSEEPDTPPETDDPIENTYKSASEKSSSDAKDN